MAIYVSSGDISFIGSLNSEKKEDFISTTRQKKSKTNELFIVIHRSLTNLIFKAFRNWLEEGDIPHHSKSIDTNGHSFSFTKELSEELM